MNIPNPTPEEWEKEFWEIVEELGVGGNIVCFQKLRDLFCQELHKREQTARQEENKAWLEGQRCSTCGNEMKPDGINDTCENCWETN